MNTLKQALLAQVSMKNNKHIFHIIISLQRGGFETALLRMLPHLQEDFRHTIVTLKEPGSMAPLFKERGIDVLCLNQKNLFDIFSYFRLWQILKIQKPDLIFTYLLHADIVGRFFIQFFVPCKVISSLGTTYNFKKYWPARLFERLSKPLAAGYMANAQSVRDVYVEKFGVSKEKIWVVPCGIDISVFENVSVDYSLQKELGIQPEDFVIICVANLHVNKGHRYLLEAFEDFFAEYPESKLILVGEGEERKALEKQIENYSSKHNVLFLGKRTDVPNLLALSNVFVLPTFFEGLSNAIMEAMAAKVLVIATDIPENRQLITNEETGFLIPTKTAIDLKRVLVKVKKNSYSAIREQAYLNLKQDYDIHKKILVWNNFFHKLS